MKQFDCADVIPGCGASFRAETATEVMQHGRNHAMWAHGLTEAELTPELLAAVASGVRDVG
jgi:predicted small metal-binding protein